MLVENLSNVIHVENKKLKRSSAFSDANKKREKTVLMTYVQDVINMYLQT